MGLPDAFCPVPLVDFLRHEQRTRHHPGIVYQYVYSLELCLVEGDKPSVTSDFVTLSVR